MWVYDPVNLGQVWLMAAEQGLLRPRLRTVTRLLYPQPMGQSHKDISNSRGAENGLHPLMADVAKDMDIGEE